MCLYIWVSIRECVDYKAILGCVRILAKQWARAWETCIVWEWGNHSQRFFLIYCREYIELCLGGRRLNWPNHVKSRVSSLLLFSLFFFGFWNGINWLCVKVLLLQAIFVGKFSQQIQWCFYSLPRILFIRVHINVYILSQVLN